MANNTNNKNSALSSTTSFAAPTTTSHAAGNSEVLSKLSPNILKAYTQLALGRDISTYELLPKPISGVGENSYGLILQMYVNPTKATRETEINGNNKETDVKPNAMINILKISPKNSAFRAHSRIKELYQREAFMYQKVFPEFQKLFKERIIEIQNSNKNCDSNFQKFDFDIVPELLYSCLDENDEFFIFEDLTLNGYQQNQRTKMPTFDLVAATFRSIAKFHAMSFVLQKRKSEIFQNLIQQIDDNLFVENIEPITIEFGKKYVRKTRVMLEQEGRQVTTTSVKQIEALQKLEDNFKKVCMQCVNGSASAPYAVICHGDFWNNNMLYKCETTSNNNETTSAKFIDFQLSRYAAPVLDLVHYLYTCTERELRKKHFSQFLEFYYQTLSEHIEFYGYEINEIYPRHVFMQQLQEFGIFGLCMAAFAIPFFISNTSELPDLDEVATAIREISSSENSDAEDETSKNGITEAAHKRKELLDEYDLLSERTLPIFRRRMFGIVKDLEKHEMFEKLMKI